MFAVPRERVVRIHASSGTTGRPTVVGYTAKDIDTWATVMARSIRAAGGRAGDVCHVAYGYGLFTGGLRARHRGPRLRWHARPGPRGGTPRQGGAPPPPRPPGLHRATHPPPRLSRRNATGR